MSKPLLALLNYGQSDMAPFDQLPDVKRRVARGDYEFVSRVDIELDEIEREAQRNGFVLDSNRDGQHLVYTIQPMSRKDHAAFLAEE